MRCYSGVLLTSADSLNKISTGRSASAKPAFLFDGETNEHVAQYRLSLLFRILRLRILTNKREKVGITASVVAGQTVS